MLEQKIERLIELKAQIESLQAEFDTIKEGLSPEISDMVTHNGYTVSKYVKATPKLKDGVDEFDLNLIYPEYFKKTFDVAKFAKERGDVAMDLVDIKETEVVVFAKARK